MVLLQDDDTCFSRADLKALNFVQHPMWIFDVERIEMYWANPAGLEVWNSPNLQELLGRDFRGDLTEAMRIRMDDNLERLKRGETYTEQYTFYPNGGPGVTVDVAISGIRVEGGRIAGLIEAELLDNINEDAVLAAETLRHTPISCSRYAVDGTLQYQNPEAIKVFGPTFDDKKRMDFVSRFLDRELGKVVLQKLQAGEDSGKPTEAELYTKTGPRWFALRARRIRNPVSKKKEREYMIVDTARDITEIKRAQQDTRRARIKNDFLAQIAHEIRTPLHQVVGHMDLLELQQLTTEQRETVHTVQSSISHLMTIISDMMDYSKLESGMLQLDHVPFGLQDMVDCSIAAIRQDLEEKQLKFDLHMLNQDNPTKDVPARLVGDPNRLRQILHNFLENAIKFTEKGSVTFTISTIKDLPIKADTETTKEDRKQEAKANDSHTSSGTEQSSRAQLFRFEIKDTGIGMDETQKVAVFEKYKQAHSGIKANYGGVGLGLAICKHLVKLMKGRLGVESVLHKGTTVWFEVPFDLPEPDEVKSLPEQMQASTTIKDGLSNPQTTQAATATPTKGTNPQAGEHRSLHVLVVEDNKINQKMVRNMLQRIGHKVSVAENGQVCLDELKRAMDTSTPEQPVDLVLMDIQMPVMDGIEATRKIREELNYLKCQLPVVGLTASYRHEDLDYYVGIGMNTCIGKPVKLNMLKRVIESHGSGSPAAEELKQQ